MAEDKLCKNDIVAVFKRLRNIPANKVCFDCQAKNPTWASVTYGVFICIHCSAVHRSLGVHLSFVRSTQLDTNWNWLQLRAMQVGGNLNAILFFQQHGCTTTDAQQKYNSRAAQLYREKLHHQATAAIRLHGTKLHIETPHVQHPHSPEHKEADFFKDATEANLSSAQVNQESMQNKSPSMSRNLNHQNNNKNGHDLCVNLESSLFITPSNAQQKTNPQKSSIMGRKPATNKKTLTGMGGLGARKVNTNFSEVEKEAQRTDDLRIQDAASEAKAASKPTPEEEAKQKASIRLAYQDISVRQKETEEKLKQTDPRKAEQLERLGMGFGPRSNSSSVGHSVASEMKLITQENVPAPSKKNEVDVEDDFEFFNFASGPPKYGDSPFMSRSSSDRISDISSKDTWTRKNASIDLAFHKEKSPRSKPVASKMPVITDEAQKKFGNVKSISSEQYFGPARDADFERRENLTRFEGSSSISSEDFFGGDSSRSNRGASSSFSSPNLYEIKEGVRDGVNKVAGRLSSLANGVMNSLQDRYGY